MSGDQGKPSLDMPRPNPLRTAGIGLGFDHRPLNMHALSRSIVSGHGFKFWVSVEAQQFGFVENQMKPKE